MKTTSRKKPGPKRTATNPHATHYDSDADGFKAGTTIAEFEARRGLPLFSVWPEAEAARAPMDPGRFLYVNATEEERAELGPRQLHAAVRPAPPRSDGTAVFSSSPELTLLDLSTLTNRKTAA